MSASRGKFIAIEGGEGAGKSSVIQCLRNALRLPHEQQIIFTREPGGTRYAEEIRELVLNPKSQEPIFAETELMLFSAARCQHVGNLIAPELARGHHVISDRFSLGTIAYQLYGRGRTDLIHLFRSLDALVVGSFQPDMCVLLDVEPLVGLARRANTGDTNRIDKESLEFHEMVRCGFFTHIQDYQYSVVVDANRPQADVQQEVLSLVQNFLTPNH